MKKTLLLHFIVFISSSTFAQVGINTNNPTNTLDVNGDARIRDVNKLTTVPTYILAPDDNGVVSKIETSSIASINNSNYNNGIPKIAVVATGSDEYVQYTGTSNPIGFSNKNVIPLSNLQYINSDLITFNTSNSTFVVKQSGYYRISIEATIQADTGGGGTTAVYLGNSTSDFVTGTTQYSESSTSFPFYSSLIYLNEGETYDVRAFHNRNYSIKKGKFTLTIFTTNNN